MPLRRAGPSVKFEDAYYESSKVLIWFGLVVGVFPVSRDSEGTFRFRWVSARTFYSIFVYVSTSSAVAYSTYTKILKLRNAELPFDDYLFTLIFLTTLTPHWLVQVVTVAFGKDFAEYLTTWSQFQKHFLLATGRTVMLDSSVKFVITLSFGTIMAVVLPMAQTVMMGDFTLYESVGFYHVLTLYTFLCVWWSFQCVAFVRAVRNLREKMRKELTENPTHVEIRRYRHLWEQIYSLVEKMSSSMRCVYGVYNFFTYCSLFFSVYCTVSHIAGTRQAIRAPKLAGFFVCVIYFGIHTYGFCNSSHFLEEEIAHAVVNDLTELRLYRLSDANTREVHSFLNTINAKKVGLVVCGNLTIGRGTLTAYASSMAMYCVVLLQFKIALPRVY